MLLQEKIIIKPCNAHLSRYSAMGYDVKKKFDKKGRERMVLGQCIEVNVFDLPKTSNEEVLCSCDYCGKEYYEKWKNVRAVIFNDFGKYFSADGIIQQENKGIADIK